MAQSSGIMGKFGGHTTAKMFSTLKTTWPIILALAFNRCGAIYGSYGSYASTDAGLATDGGTLLGIAILFIPFVLIGLGKLGFDDRRATRFLYVSACLQCLCIAAITATSYLPAPDLLKLCLHTANGILEILIGGCWLRQMRAVPTSITIFTLFVALATSEVLFWPGYFTNDLGDGIFACIVTLGQLSLVGIAAKHAPQLRQVVHAYQVDEPWNAHDEVNNASFLVVNGICLALLSMVVGFLRGFPAGEAIALDLPFRMGYFVLLIIMCLASCWFLLHRSRQAGIVGMWASAQVLASLAMILYAAFPDTLGVGAAVTTVVNALCVVYIWALTVEFMSYGDKDPFYYQIGGRIVFMGGRAVSRMAEGFLAVVLGMTPLLMVAIASGLLVLSTTLLVYLLTIRPQGAQTSKTAQDGPAVPYRLRTIMGVNIDDKSTLSDMREATMRRQVEQIGRQFLLSGREVEVLTLYALGFKQQNVAEQLGISPGTVHAHIKRIYSKTDMHSRQDVLDYIDKYCS